MAQSSKNTHRRIIVIDLPDSWRNIPDLHQAIKEKFVPIAKPSTKAQREYNALCHALRKAHIAM